MASWRRLNQPRQAEFVRDVLQNASVREIFARWQHLLLPDGWLVAGCLFQTVWNLRSGALPAAGIKDYDFFYFDASDMSAAGEEAVQDQVAAALADLHITVEAINQARVHLWYEEHFGHPYAPLSDSREGIARFLVPATAVGLRPAGDAWDLHAPYGLDLMYDGVLTPNPLTDHRDLFRRKAASYQQRWPWLRISEEGL